MLKVYGCLVHEHDLRLVVLAIVIASLGSYTSISLLRQTVKLAGQNASKWLCARNIGDRLGDLGNPFRCDARLSAAGSRGLRYGPDRVVARDRHPSHRVRLHYRTLAAWAGQACLRRSRGRVGASSRCITWECPASNCRGSSCGTHALVMASVVMALGFGAGAMVLGLNGQNPYCGLGAAGLLALAICSLHFTGMAAASIELTGGVAPNYNAFSVTLIAISVAFVSGFILLLSLTALQLYRRNLRRIEREQANLRQLADISVEGLVVCKGRRDRRRQHQPRSDDRAREGRALRSGTRQPVRRPASCFNHYFDQ